MVNTAAERLQDHLPLSHHSREKVKAATQVLQERTAQETDQGSKEVLDEQLATLDALRQKDHQARQTERRHRHEEQQQSKAQARQRLEEPINKLGDNLFGFPCFDKKPINTAVGETPRPEYEVMQRRHAKPQS
ncbi:hypothetical protein WJX84_009737 [Apatococcus fuscideae]|uniref:Uncharacterized protein n=1 Tax=Apatococcus fuscideae TaxID=2026836 RepID=A0AAW1SZF1_9CHLO